MPDNNENGVSKEERLRQLKRLYNAHKITYKQYMLECAKVNKYWDTVAENEAKTEAPVETEATVVDNDENVELPPNPEL